MKKVRYGIIGVGNQGSTYALEIFDKGRAPESILTAICDINPDKLDYVKEKIQNKEIACFDNYIDMLDSGLCDAVLVETPHYDHPEMVIACLERNIHVITDKPAGVYAKQVKQMNAVASRSEALFGMMFNQRTNCLYRKMRELIADGVIGELIRVNWIITDWFRTQAYYDGGNWRATWSGEGGGVLINQCPHQLDLLQWIVGKMPVAVRGFCQYGAWHNIEVEDEVTAYLEYEGGATGVFISTTGEAPGTNRLEIAGTGGKLLCEKGKLWLYKNNIDCKVRRETAEEAYSSGGCVVTEVETDGENPQHAGIINNFTATILGEEELFVKGEEGLAMVELMNAIEYSGWHGGERVTIPVDEDKYLAELEEHIKASKPKEFVKETITSTKGSYGAQ